MSERNFTTTTSNPIETMKDLPKTVSEVCQCDSEFKIASIGQPCARCKKPLSLIFKVCGKCQRKTYDRVGNEDGLNFCWRCGTKLSKVFSAVAAMMVMMLVLLTGCTDREPRTITLTGQKLITASLGHRSLLYLTRPMRSDEIPETYKLMSSNIEEEHSKVIILFKETR